MKANVGVLLDNRYLDHSITARSPENPERLRRLVSEVQERFRDSCTWLGSRRAAREEIEAVHSSL